jgi:hypothetical protein
MPKTKYKYNHETLSFDRIKLGLRQIFLRFFGYFVRDLPGAGLLLRRNKMIGFLAG